MSVSSTPSEVRLHVALARVGGEYRRARQLHPALNSGHEGYAVILEELDELWSHVKGNTADTSAAYEEAMQVAAMAVAFMVEVAQ